MVRGNTGNSAALDMDYAFVMLNNGTPDNVQIVCPKFDFAALYKSRLESSDSRSQTTDRTRCYNAKNGVMVSGNSRILTSRIPDKDTLEADLEQYGEYACDDFADYITYEQFVAFNGTYLKISVEKGYITWGEILELISIHPV